MSTFSDFNELYDPLVLPINGKEYQIPPASFEAGARINGIIDGAEQLTDEEFFRLVLGGVFDDMVADKVPAAAITRAGQTALADFRYGRGMAETMWKTGGDPKAIQELLAPKPNRAARRSKGTGVGNKTP
ncbi:MAG: hypothetical protein JSS52_11295 [Proteobacteria bacterium]|nr:hypothetical protein [Pseudomonadota bacterium]